MLSISVIPYLDVSHFDPSPWVSSPMEFPWTFSSPMNSCWICRCSSTPKYGIVTMYNMVYGMIGLDSCPFANVNGWLYSPTKTRGYDQFWENDKNMLLHMKIIKNKAIALENLKPFIIWLSFASIWFHHNLYLFDYSIIPIGSMVLLYMVTWIPSIYPLYVSINIPAPWIRHGIENSWPIMSFW